MQATTTISNEQIKQRALELWEQQNHEIMQGDGCTQQG